MSESSKRNTVKLTCYSIENRASAVRCKLAAACAIVAGTLVTALDVFWVIGACSGDVRPPCSRTTTGRHANACAASATTIDGGIYRGEYGEERDDGEGAHSSSL